MDLKFKTLKNFGLSKKEIKVYIEALKEDNLSPYKISKLTKIPRTTVYDVLMNLSLKGLVELEQSDGMTKQQTLVRAKNPSVLRNILQKKRKKLVSLEADIIEILPGLKGSYHKDKANAFIKFYPGIEGAKKTQFDLEFMKLKLPIFSWDMLMPMDIYGSKSLNIETSKENIVRKQFGVEQKELLPLNDWTKHVLSYQYGRDKDYLSQIQMRVVDSPVFELFLRLMIKGNYVVISCADEDEMWGLKIRSKALSKSLKSIYMLNWQLGIPVTLKLIKSWGKSEMLEEEILRQAKLGKPHRKQRKRRGKRNK